MKYALELSELIADRTRTSAYASELYLAGNRTGYGEQRHIVGLIDQSIRRVCAEYRAFRAA